MINIRMLRLVRQRDNVAKILKQKHHAENTGTKQVSLF